MFSYTRTGEIILNLRRFDEVRKDILVTPLPPRKDLQMKWEATLSRINAAYEIEGNKIGMDTIKNAIANAQPKLAIKEYQSVSNLYSALEFIRNEWTMNSSLVTTSDVRQIYKFLAESNSAYKSKLTLESMDWLLKYVQEEKEHPVIQSGIIFLQTTRIEPFAELNSLLALLLAYLFLYKHGYNFNDWIVIGENWVNNPANMSKAKQVGFESGNFTPWLSFYVQHLQGQLNSIKLRLAKDLADSKSSETLWELNERQKYILRFLANPNNIITNKNVQTLFKISQITASRDLAKLLAMGYIISRGKGRAVSYIKR